MADSKIKLKSYLSTAAGIAASGSIHAQTYVDIEPDLVLNTWSAFGSEALLDMDQDGLADIKISGYELRSSYTTSFGYTTWTSTSCGGSTSNYIVITHVYKKETFEWTLIGLHSGARVARFSDGNAEAFNAGETIGPFAAPEFAPSANLYYDYAFNQYSYRNQGYFNGNELMAGIEIKKGGIPYYGWVRMSLNDKNELVLHDHALGREFLSLTAGDTNAVGFVSQGELNKGSLQCWWNDHILTVRSSEPMEACAIRVFDALGKEVAKDIFTHGKEWTLNTLGWKPGSYTAWIQQQQGKARRVRFLIR